MDSKKIISTKTSMTIVRRRLNSLEGVFGKVIIYYVINPCHKGGGKHKQAGEKSNQAIMLFSAVFQYEDSADE